MSKNDVDPTMQPVWGSLADQGPETRKLIQSVISNLIF